MAVNSDNILKRLRGIKLDANNNYRETPVDIPSTPGSSDEKSGDLPSFCLKSYPPVEDIRHRRSKSRARTPSPNVSFRARPDSPHPHPLLNAPSNASRLRPLSSSSNNNKLPNPTASVPSETKKGASTNHSHVKTQSINEESKKAPESKKNSTLTKRQKIVLEPVINKKKVSFAPDVIVHERETKPPRASSSRRALQPFGDRKLGFFIPPASELIRCISPIPNRQVVPILVNKVSMQYRVPDTFGRKIEENDYVRFSHIWRTPNMESRKNDDKCIVRLKRIHNIMTDLTDSHSLYRYIPESIKTKFLQEEILTRYVMALDLVLTESLLGVAIAIANTIRETIGFLHKVFYGDFFDEDHSALNLPSVNETGPDYVDKVAPIIFTLNRISGEHTRSDSSYMSKETACTKLILELMALTVLPSNSVMFRCVLGIIAETANSCIKFLSEVQDEAMLGWVNNSVMRRECMICMSKLGLVDEFGAKAVLPALSLATIYAMSNNTPKKISKDKPRHRSKATTIGPSCSPCNSRPPTPKSFQS